MLVLVLVSVLALVLLSLLLSFFGAGIVVGVGVCLLEIKDSPLNVGLKWIIYRFTFLCLSLLYSSDCTFLLLLGGFWRALLVSFFLDLLHFWPGFFLSGKAKYYFYLLL